MPDIVMQKSIVLYADDDKDDIELVQDAFRRYSKNVDFHSFTNGIELLSFIQALTAEDSQPCLIILDINMPLLDGRQTLLRIKQITGVESIPIILFSTSSMNVDKIWAVRHGAGFITKPLNIQQMEFIIGQFIDHCADEVQHRIKKQVG
ncbi:MAG: response regulator [Chitinophagaceae bacterium]